MPAKLISARAIFSTCRVVGDLFRRQKTLGLRTYHGGDEGIFFERLAARKTISMAIFDDQTPAIDHGPLRVQTALFD
jgi:hypothetical protein